MPEARLQAIPFGSTLLARAPHDLVDVHFQILSSPILMFVLVILSFRRRLLELDFLCFILMKHDLPVPLLQLLLAMVDELLDVAVREDVEHHVHDIRVVLVQELQLIAELGDPSVAGDEVQVVLMSFLQC